MAKTAVIIGARGQDGRLLQELLCSKRYRLACIERGATRVEGLEWKEAVDITRATDVFHLIQEFRPDEVYHLAAIHHSSQESAREDLELFRISYEVNFFSLLHFLEAIRLYSRKTRLFYASSSHVFGNPPSEVQSEETPFSPQSVYAMTKVDGLLACRQYRRAHQVFASVGILYNHESKYRQEKFLSKKVIRAVSEIKRGSLEELALGNLDTAVDWGYAPDYVEAMHAILAAPEAGEFIVATGVKHTAREFVQAAFREAGLDWKQWVSEENPQVMGRGSQARIGNASKLMSTTGWMPKTSFLEMIRILLEQDSVPTSLSEGW